MRTCRRDELELWYAFPMTRGRRSIAPPWRGTFDAVYRPHGDAFWRSCLFVCDAQDVPVGTCFAWKAYGRVTTIHWFKVRRDCEGHGLGRGLLSHVMRSLNEGDFPVFLAHAAGQLSRDQAVHRHGLRAADRPGDRLSQKRAGEPGLPFLQAHMPPEAYARLRFDRAPEAFLQAVRSARTDEF